MLNMKLPLTGKIVNWTNLWVITKLNPFMNMIKKRPNYLLEDRIGLTRCKKDLEIFTNQTY